MSTTTVLAAIGAIVVCRLLINALWSTLELILSFLTPYFVPGHHSLTDRFGTWAAVTGGTDGIGRQYAEELARRGLNIVIISRNPDKLRAVAHEIEEKHNVKTKIVVADFSRGADVLAHIEHELKDIPLGILVNNVGCLNEYPMPLCEVPMEKVWELINVNVGAVTGMTRLVLPAMAARGRGAIVNISSGSELQPIPLMAVYAATKAYVRSFTVGVREEYAHKGVYIQNVAPFFVATNMVSYSPSIMKGNLFVPDAKTFVRHAVRTLGRVNETSGYWAHGVQTFAMKLCPEWVLIKSSAIFNQWTRKEYLDNLKTKTK